MAHTSNVFICQILPIIFIFFIVAESNFTASNGTSLDKNVTSIVQNVTTKINNSTIFDTTHRGREGWSASTVPKLTTGSEKLVNKSVKIIQLKNTTTPLNTTLPVNFKQTLEITNATTNNTNTLKATIIKVTTPKSRKPERTEHDEVEIPTSKSDNYISMVHIDTSMDKKVRRADYIVPIVAVILSVPLVAIIISVLYKRGKDWWQHRNYRRMDYLIEGMYNS